jgi:hypothetical protein
MLLSLSKSFLFIHIPKTAGGSIDCALQPWAIQSPRTHYRRLLSHLPIRENPQKASLRTHATADWVRLKLGNELFDRLYKFAFVRNPFDWIVSRYEYIRQTPEHHRNRTVAKLDFSDFVGFEQARCLKRRMDQSHFLLSRSGELLVDDVFRFESLEADTQSVFERLNLQPPQALPHRHRTQRRPYQEYYSNADRIRVAELYARDLERFGYEF